MSEDRTLEGLRNKLLDLTRRNKLLNFRHTKGMSLRVIDELPDQLVETLLAQKSMQFIPVPDPKRHQLIEAGYIEVDNETGEETAVKEMPTSRQWGEHLGLSVSEEMPSPLHHEDEPEGHKDNKIQTGLFPKVLEGRLRGLTQRSNAAIEEMGTNILYLSLGFLEWYEDSNSNKANYAPLFLVPVNLQRGSLDKVLGIFKYTISYSGEDIMTNLSLAEKLKRDFGMELPMVEDDSTPERYLESVRDLIRNSHPRWKVRRWVSLALLNFNKLLMYLDLDAARWPGDEGLKNHEIVQQILRGPSEETDENEAPDFLREYSIDETPEIHTTSPLVFDADSSQHSALIDALEGKNLVVEGPPGTGKSQTISNLIAAALGRGKTVLFVAEKLAALEVVKRRLDHADLGDFCLELHSHKTQKRAFLDNIQHRLDRKGKFPAPATLQRKIDAYEQEKTTLNNYVEAINSTFGQLDESIHQVLSSARRYADELEQEPAQFHPENIDPESLKPTDIEHIRHAVGVYIAAISYIQEQLEGTGLFLSSHPWRGVNNHGLRTREPEVEAAMARWRTALTKLQACLGKLGAQFGTSQDVLPQNEKELKRLLEDFSIVPESVDETLIGYLPTVLNGNLEQTEEFAKLATRYAELAETLRQHLPDNVLSNASAESELSNGISVLLEYCEPATTLEETYKGHDGLKAAVEKLSNISGELSPALTVVQGPDKRDGLVREETSTTVKVIELASELEPRLVDLRHECFHGEEIDYFLQELETELEELEVFRAGTAECFNTAKVLESTNLERIKETLNSAGRLGWLSKDYREARKNLLELRKNPSTRFKICLAKLEDATQYRRRYKKLNVSELYRGVFQERYEGPSTDIEALKALRHWYMSVQAHFGVGFGPSAKTGERLLEADNTILLGLHQLHRKGAPSDLLEADSKISAASKVFQRSQPLSSSNAVITGSNSHIEQEFQSIDLAIRQSAVADFTKTTSLSELQRIAILFAELQSVRSRFGATDIQARVFSNAINVDLEPACQFRSVIARIQSVLSLAIVLERKVANKWINQHLIRHPENQTLAKLHEFAKELEAIISTESLARTHCIDLTELSTQHWMQSQIDTFENRISRIDHALQHSDQLSSWLQYLRGRREVFNAGLQAVTAEVESGNLQTEHAETAALAGVYDLCARRIMASNPVCMNFLGFSHEEAQKRFKEIDVELFKLQRENIANLADRRRLPRGRLGQRVGDLTETHLLKHEIGKQKRHISIRKLMERSGNALQSLKPCFMMGPMSVAQYLAPGHLHFDLVIFDEASQMKPEDSLGAVARGQQFVVVGDPKQLPPTSFFDSLDSTDEEDDTDLIDEAESILEAAIKMFPARRLRWHYRSQHQSLISFSNHHFYDNDLVIFPSPKSDSKELGVNFHKVVNGRFQGQTNIQEASKIAQAVRRQLLENPNESVGVVAMNAKQREQIECEVEALSIDDAKFRKALAGTRSTPEPFFVKNLENVQGDERDVILISMTYGPDAKGIVMQRFGPINRDTGWRRLNVLFSRAKRRMEIFSSMSAEDIRVEPHSRRGVKALKGFLSYAETGLLYDPGTAGTGRPPDSDFEIAVAARLEASGYKCEMQVGAADYFIDLAVYDPGNNTRFLMGIECDGATYHSAKSARDRDRLRQSVLESLGWRIRRIWSTDWFDDADAALRPILTELERLRTPVSEAEPVAEEQAALIVAHNAVEQPDLEESLDEVSEFLATEESLNKKLARFDEKVIRPKFPDTPKNSRLLRGAMIEALEQFAPETKREFLERIPAYLRAGTNPQEARHFLDEVLEIVQSRIGNSVACSTDAAVES